MSEGMRLIEFVSVSLESRDNPCIGLYDAKEIVNIQQNDKKHCWLIMRSGDKKLICGTYRTLTNRWIYSLEKKHSFYHDEIMRPSVMLFHKPETMGIDNSYSDSYQLFQFIQAVRPEILTTYQYIFDEYEQYVESV